MNIDIETKSGVDITRCSVYRYAEDPLFDILLFGVSVDGGPVRVYDLAGGEQLPEAILSALTEPGVMKYAYNASFERVCLSCWLQKKYPLRFKGYDDMPYLDPASWRCTMVLAAYNGLPLSLEKAGEALNLEQQKLREGRDLIRFFCVPGTVMDHEAGSVWNLPSRNSEKWDLFKKYNKRDVQTEMSIRQKLQDYPVPESVWAEYVLDQKINDLGIRIDPSLVTQAIRIYEKSRADLTSRLQSVTGLENPNSPVRLKAYLADHGLEMESLSKQCVAESLETAPDNLAEVLSLHRQLSKSSVKKYEAMACSVCADGRCHGLFQFYGANRTGRWAGRLVQLQNLPQNHMPDLDEARELVRQGDYISLCDKYESVPGVLSELIRTAFVPSPGFHFVVMDFSSIEARVLSYIAGEAWRNEVFHAGRDLYCETASRMFLMPVEKNGVNGHLRKLGKVCELALGYGGGVNALRAMGGEALGLREDELQNMVKRWREASPRIVQFWWNMDRAIKEAVKKRENRRLVLPVVIPTEVEADPSKSADLGNGSPTECGSRSPVVTPSLSFSCNNGMLFISLPSGRRLSYIRPRLGENRFGGESVFYLGTDSTGKWGWTESYGPKFTENIVQAVSRDILAFAMQNLSRFRIVAHVHDEVILEVPPETSLDALCALMSQAPPWLPGLELRADGYECDYYRKD